MKIPNNTLVEVHGNPLQGLDFSLLRVRHGPSYYGIPTYQFFRPRGKKPVARHLVDSVDLWVRNETHPDINKIVIVKTEDMYLPHRLSCPSSRDHKSFLLVINHQARSFDGTGMDSNAIPVPDDPYREDHPTCITCGQNARLKKRK